MTLAALLGFGFLKGTSPGRARRGRRPDDGDRGLAAAAAFLIARAISVSGQPMGSGGKPRKSLIENDDNWAVA